MTFLRRFTVALLPVLLCASQLSAQSSANITESASTLTFTTIDVPGAGYTGAFGINSAGDIVGNYGQNINTDSSGFLYSKGTFSLISYPGQAVTVPTKINDSGLVVGYAGQDPVVGFLYDGTNFSNLQDGGDSATLSLGINNAGLVVGGAGTIYTTRGFQERSGQFKNLNVPGQYVYVYATGVNNSGVIVGWTDYDGFLCRGSKCKIFSFPGAIQTEPWGINDSGVIVGWYNPGSSITSGFSFANGKYSSFVYPGAMGTFPRGINASGQIVGEYTLDYQTYHGFIANPTSVADSQ